MDEAGGGAQPFDDTTSNDCEVTSTNIQSKTILIAVYQNLLRLLLTLHWLTSHELASPYNCPLENTE